MAVHIARIGLLSIGANGAVITKSTASINAYTTTSYSTEHRVLYNSTYAPNAGDSPTIEEYLTLEYAAGYHLVHMDQMMIVTDNI